MSSNDDQNKPTKITADQAFHDYCRLGIGTRSLKKLYDLYKGDDAVETVAYETIRRWSARHNWPERVREHDDQVVRRANEKGREADAEALMNASTAFRQLSEEMIEHLRGKLKEIRVNSPHDVATMVSAAVEAAKVAEVLTGGVSDRTEDVSNGDQDNRVDRLIARIDKLSHEDQQTTQIAVNHKSNGQAIH